MTLLLHFKTSTSVKSRRKRLTRSKLLNVVEFSEDPFVVGFIDDENDNEDESLFTADLPDCWRLKIFLRRILRRKKYGSRYTIQSVGQSRPKKILTNLKLKYFPGRSAKVRMRYGSRQSKRPGIWQQTTYSFVPWHPGKHHVRVAIKTRCLVFL